MQLTNNCYGVVILNWNGFSDTIECVESVIANNDHPFVIIVDNGSQDDSIDRIVQWGKNTATGLLTIGKDALPELNSEIVNSYKVLLCKTDENLGFAKGCNLGLAIAVMLNLKHVVMLNNDTISHQKSLDIIVQYLEQNQNISATIPKIKYYQTDRIWNCGGSISKFGYRKYFYPGLDDAKVDMPRMIECTFFTGCCFAVRTDEFNNRNGFTENFFFGEEDFELSLWMKDHNKKAVCLTGCIVEHKVGASIKNASSKSQASKVYVHYLNRFIHMKSRFNRMIWYSWLFFYSPYIAMTLLKNKTIPRSELFSFFSSLIKNANKYSVVDKSLFESIMKDKLW